MMYKLSFILLFAYLTFLKPVIYANEELIEDEFLQNWLEFSQDFETLQAIRDAQEFNYYSFDSDEEKESAFI